MLRGPGDRDGHPAYFSALDELTAHLVEIEFLEVRLAARLGAVVGASPAATRDNLETANLLKVMGRGALGHRHFVSPNSFDPKSLLDAVSGLYYDQMLSRTIFGDAYRMGRDLFAPVAVALSGFSYSCRARGPSPVPPP